MSPPMFPLRWLVSAMGGVAAAVAAGVAGAQTVPLPGPAALPFPPLATAAPPAEVPTVRGFSISGQNPLSSGDEALALAPFFRAPATLDTLQRATAALEAALVKQGHVLHRVVLPPQEVGEVIRLEMVHFSMGQVVVEGNQHFDVANIRASLPELNEGGVPRLGLLAVQTALANANPAKQLQVGLRAAPDADRIDATVKVQDGRPVAGSLTVSNMGTAATGRDRVTLAGQHSNLFNRDHQLAGAYTTSAVRPGDVKQLGLTYRAPLYRQGGMVDASYTRSSVVGSFGSGAGAFTSTGAGHTWGLGYTQHLEPQDGLQRDVSLLLEDKVFDATALNGAPLAGQVARRSRPLSLGYRVKRQSDGAYWDAGVTLAANLPGGSGNSLAAYQSEKPVVSTSGWRALRAQASHVQALGVNWLLGGRLQAQWSSTALMAGEQFGLGGFSSLRGAQERVLAGDSGWGASLELTSPEWLPGLRLLGFVDAGGVRARQLPGSLAPARDSASSVGLGLRFNRDPVVLALDYGQVVGGSRAPVAANPQAPRHGDHKLHFTLSARF